MVEATRFDNWDAIIHETGHVFRQQNGFFPFSLLDYARGCPHDPQFGV
jgi:hypothetical protein